MVRTPIHIGNPHGKIAIWCDEQEAIELAGHYSYKDGFYKDIMDAVEQAYPKQEATKEQRHERD